MTIAPFGYNYDEMNAQNIFIEGKMVFLKVFLNIVFGVPSAAIVSKYIIEGIGGKLEIPGVELSPIMGFFVTFALVIFWLVKAYAMYEKTRSDKQQRIQENRMKKAEVDKFISDQNIKRGTVETTNEQYREIVKLEDRQREEMQALINSFKK